MTRLTRRSKLQRLVCSVCDLLAARAVLRREAAIPFAAKLNTTPEALQTAYEQARATNPKLTRGQFIAANMLGRNLSDKGITTDKILAGLASGQSMGKTLQSLGLSDKEAKQAESKADHDVKAADKAAKTGAPAKPDSGH